VPKRCVIQHFEPDKAGQRPEESFQLLEWQPKYSTQNRLSDGDDLEAQTTAPNIDFVWLSYPVAISSLLAPPQLPKEFMAQLSKSWNCLLGW
jgi:hypothetical protein